MSSAFGARDFVSRLGIFYLFFTRYLVSSSPKIVVKISKKEEL